MLSFISLMVVLIFLISTGCEVNREEITAEKTPAERTVKLETTEVERKPNIVLIMTDDQDVDSTRYMPKLQKTLVDHGTTFTNSFVSTPLCCPSRATFLRGQYEHNHRVLTNSAPEGGYNKWRKLGRQRSTVGRWLDDAGYDTVLLGKYINEYDRRIVPPGWDQWYARLDKTKNSQTYRVNENGKIARYDHDTLNTTDYLSRRAARYIRFREGDQQPFFMYLATDAPHKPARNAARHDGEFVGEPLPRPPSFGEKDVSDKPERVRGLDPFTPGDLAPIAREYRQRLRSLQAVDDLVENVVDAARDAGELDNTYFVFTSDNGWHTGEHRFPRGKGTPYEESISVPLVVRGPGVPVQEVPHLVLNNDFAPTAADWADAPPPNFVDGKSLAPLLSEDLPEPGDWRQQVLIEHLDIGYRAVRTQDIMYIEHTRGQKELYDLRTDPYQLESRHDSDPKMVSLAASKLKALRGCEGEECRAAEMSR